MTYKLYWDDPYMKEFDCKVESINKNEAILDKTAFYIRGGGLASDTGGINGIKVINVLSDKSGNAIHILEKEPDFQVGQNVHGKIDWNRRHRIMRMHTTAHIISSIINRETGALITGGNIEPDKSRIDFNIENLDKEKFMQYIDEANKIAQQNLPVKSYLMKREEAMKIPGIVKLAEAAPPTETDELRIVEITGVDIQADGGVHVNNTSEIGKIQAIKIENKGKNNKRLYYTVE